MTARVQGTRRVAACGAQASRTQVAANIVRLRCLRSLSLSDLAASSGLEASLLEQLEASERTPNIDELWALARALSVPFGAFLQPELPNPAHRDRSGVLVSRPVLPTTPGKRGTELFELRLSARSTKVVCPRPAGSIDNLLVTSGSLTIDVADAHHCLETGDSIEIASDLERRYINFADRSATMYVVVTHAT